MAKIRDVPGVGPVEFPEAWSEEQIARSIQVNVQALQRAGPGQALSTGPSRARLMMEDFSQFTKQHAVPMAMAAGSGGASLLAQAAGGAVATALNQALGGEQGDPTQIGLAGALPVAGAGVSRAVAGGARWLGAHLPGAAGALNQAISDQARKILPGLVSLPGQQTADDLFALVDQVGGTTRIPTGPLTARLQGIVTKIGNKSEGAQALFADVDRYARGLLDKITPYGASVPLSVLKSERADFNLFLSKFDAGGQQRAVANELFGAILDAFKGAATNPALPAARTYLQAVERMSKEKAQGELADILTQKVITQPRSGDLAISFDGKKLLDWLKSDSADLFRRTVPAGEVEAIKAATMDLMRTWQKLPPPAGSTFGSGMVLGGYGAAGYAGGTLLGLDPAVSAATAAGASLAVSRLLMTGPGRQTLLSIVGSSGGVVSDRTASFLIAAARSGVADAGPLAGGQALPTGMPPITTEE